MIDEEQNRKDVDPDDMPVSLAQEYGCGYSTTFTKIAGNSAILDYSAI
jgi:hypothetical protein